MKSLWRAMYNNLTPGERPHKQVPGVPDPSRPRYTPPPPPAFVALTRREYGEWLRGEPVGGLLGQHIVIGDPRARGGADETVASRWSRPLAGDHT